MLPIGNRPIVDYVVEDCIKAGVTDIYFVVGTQSTQLQTYYGHNLQLEQYLRANDKHDAIKLIKPSKVVQFHYITQPADGRYGTAIPVALAATHIGCDESVLVLMGDDFIWSHDGSSEVRRLIEATPSGTSSLLAVEVPKSQVSKFGVIEYTGDHNYVRIVEKPKSADAPSNLINISKYLASPELLRQAVRYAAEPAIDNAEHYFTTIPIDRYITAGGAIKVVPARGRYLDGGTLEGWLEANNVVAQ